MSASKRDARRASVNMRMQEAPAASLSELDLALFGDVSSSGGAIVHTPEGEIQIGGYRLTESGLMTDPGANRDDWHRVGKVLRRLERSIQWLLGDWFVYGETVWGETYERIAAESGYAYQTLQDYAYVSRHVEISIRNRDLTFSHHRVVAGVKDIELQKLWLDYAIRFDLERVADFKAEFRLLNAGTKDLTDQARFDHYRYQYELLQQCICDGNLLSQIPPFKQTPKPVPSKDQQTFKIYHRYVENEIGNLPEMAPDKRAEFFERVDWLIDYYQSLRG